MRSRASVEESCKLPRACTAFRFGDVGLKYAIQMDLFLGVRGGERRRGETKEEVGPFRRLNNLNYR